MDLASALGEQPSPEKTRDENEAKKAKENYLIQSKKCPQHRDRCLQSVKSDHPRQFRRTLIKFLNYPIICLVLVSLFCKVNGKVLNTLKVSAIPTNRRPPLDRQIERQLRRPSQAHPTARLHLRRSGLLPIRSSMYLADRSAE